MTIYPNPTSGNFVIDFQNPNIFTANIRIFTIEGLQVNTKIKNFGNKLLHLDLKGIETGVYFIKINLGDRILVKKLVINR